MVLIFQERRRTKAKRTTVNDVVRNGRVPMLNDILRYELRSGVEEVWQLLKSRISPFGRTISMCPYIDGLGDRYLDD